MQSTDLDLQFYTVSKSRTYPGSAGLGLKFKFEDKYGKELTELDLISVKATTKNEKTNISKCLLIIYLTSVKSGLTIRHLLAHDQTFM